MSKVEMDIVAYDRIIESNRLLQDNINSLKNEIERLKDTQSIFIKETPEYKEVAEVANNLKNIRHHFNFRLTALRDYIGKKRSFLGYTIFSKKELLELSKRIKE